MNREQLQRQQQLDGMEDALAVLVCIHGMLMLALVLALICRHIGGLLP